MKLFALFVVILAFAKSQGAETPVALAAQGRSISSICVEKLEAMKVQMEEGWPQYGIPPMAPLQINHKDFNLEGGTFSAHGEVDDVVIHGLNEFEIIDFKVNVLLRRLNFNFNFASLNVTTDYKTDVGSGLRMHRDGGAFLAFENFNVQGQMKYTTGIISDYVTVKELKIYFSVGNVVSNIENLSKYRILNRKMNEVVEEFITLAVNDNTDYVADYIDGVVTPVLNSLIGERTLSELIALITGGGGSN